MITEGAAMAKVTMPRGKFDGINAIANKNGLIVAFPSMAKEAPRRYARG